MRCLVMAREYNFEGLIGPTHHYGGLARGNLPSAEYRFFRSHPKKAALQGLEKMRLLNRLGVKQAILPPQERPYFPYLRQMGYQGTERQILSAVSHKDPQLLLTASSSAAMWAANAATVSPSADTGDGCLHWSVANLLSQRHRAIEAPQTAKILKMMIPESAGFVGHEALPEPLGDEGAANHMRLAPRHGERGLEIFVYGKSSRTPLAREPKKFPARQSLEASQAVAAAHQLSPERVLFIQQNPAAIDRGVFHNDLIATSNENVFLFHEQAFIDTPSVIQAVKNRYQALTPQELYCFQVDEKILSMYEALRGFFFNSQIVTLPDGNMALIAPEECRNPLHASLFDSLMQADSPIRARYFVDLSESLHNGGGPACLRMRVVLTEAESRSLHGAFLFDESKGQLLESWIHQYYRDELATRDLQDFHLVEETRQALDALTRILDLGSLYSFQAGT